MKTSSNPPLYLTALVLSEDSAAKSFETVKQCVKHLLQIVDRSTETHHLDFEPATDEHVKALSERNDWQSTDPGHLRHRIALFRTIANKLLEPGGFVFHHFDGDTSWSNRDAHKTAEKFHSIVIPGVRETLRLHFEKGGRSGQEIRELVDAAMARLILVVPHYSIEAWCLQNLSVARELCAKHHRNCSGRSFFDECEQDRGLLDEIEKPKDHCCLHDKYNCELVGPGFPKEAAYEVGKSFASVANMMSQCRALTDALAMTHTYPKPPSVC